MKLRWKLLTLCGIALAFAGMAASCGPSRPFCPYLDPEGVCFTRDEGGVGGGAGTGVIGPCDGGSQFICGGIVQCTPCGT